MSRDDRRDRAHDRGSSSSSSSAHRGGGGGGDGGSSSSRWHHSRSRSRDRRSRSRSRDRDRRGARASGGDEAPLLDEFGRVIDRRRSRSRERTKRPTKRRSRSPSRSRSPHTLPPSSSSSAKSRDASVPAVSSGQNIDAAAAFVGAITASAGAIVMGDEGDEESAERAMMAAMGFGSGFASTKGKFVDDPACHLGSARTKETRKYRQYMNRTTGYDDKNVKPKKPSAD